MKKSFRIICLVLAIAFAASILISIVCSIALADGMDTRGETVYVETDAEGNVLSMISSVYITNMSGADTVTDDTTLTNIKNVLGSEAPAIDGTKATFKAEGEDVCYQGEASGELPFTLTLSYYLNGVKMSPKEIAGKSGRVRIEVECKSTLKRPVTVDGVEKELNVPFSVIGMMTLDEGCTGLASDAKISSQAGVTTIMAVMLPGLAGCIFLPGDQPLLRKESLEAMVLDFSALDEKERAILRLGFRAEDGTERLGSPVLFGSSYFGALCSLPEGKGGGVVIRQHPESVRAVYAARQEELEDADTVEELERLRKLL